MKLNIFSSTLKGTLTVPPSKSHTLRAILFACMAKGTSHIKHYLKSPDTYRMIDAVRELGALVNVQENSLIIEGVKGSIAPKKRTIDAGNSGQVLRFIGALSALSPSETTLTGDHSICHQRPVKALADALKEQGAVVSYLNEVNHPPLQITGTISPGSFSLSGEDSQPVSALLMATAFLKGPSHIYVTSPGEKPWIELTLSWMKKFGLKVKNNDFMHYEVEGNAEYEGFNTKIPGDFSSAAYPIGAALITGSCLTLYNLDMQDAQGDKKLIDTLILMGAHIEIEKDAIHIKNTGKLEGIKIDVNDFIDAITILAVIGCFASSKMEIVNASIARNKESDRIYAIATELRKMGATIVEKEDGLIIYPSILKGTTLYSHKDHRVAMALSVAALKAEGETIIEDVECIKKSYPSFIEDFQSLGANIYIVA